jgi:Mg-chelatase subunit ChlD
MEQTAVVHLYVLLDRSGSMASIAGSVVDGFNKLIADQQGMGADALITLVQFDSEDPHEVVADAVPILEMTRLSLETFSPRGGTPLLDATGRGITRAVARSAMRQAAGLPAEDIVFATITDGQENQSHELTLAQVTAMVSERSTAGWTFVFLGADLEGFADAHAMGYRAEASAAWSPTVDGASAMFSRLSHSTTRRRGLRREGRTDVGDFLTDPDAEAGE